MYVYCFSSRTLLSILHNQHNNFLQIRAQIYIETACHPLLSYLAGVVPLSLARDPIEKVFFAIGSGLFLPGIRIIHVGLVLLLEALHKRLIHLALPACVSD